MASSFDNKGSKSDQPGKRPAPTIEGSATDVTEEAREDADTKPEATSEDVDAETKDAKDKTEREEIEGARSSVPDVKRQDGGAADEPDETELAEPEPEVSTETSAEVKRSLAASLLAALTSFTTHAAAGIFGGALVLAGIGLGYVPLPQGSPQDTGPDDLAPLQARIAKLEAAPDTPDNSAKLQALETRLGELEGGTRDPSPELASLSARVDELESSLRAMAEAAKEGGSVADAAAISQQINAAEARLDTKIEEAVAKAQAADKASIAALKQDVAGLDSKLNALAETERKQADAPQLAPKVAALDDRLGKIEATLPPLLEAVDKEAEDTKAATLAMAFANLRAAVDAGQPYAAELSTLAGLSPGRDDLGRLPDYEDQGIPTLRQLTVSFKAARDAMPSAPAAEDGDTIFDRLMSSAEGLVKVRRIDGTADGSTPGAVLARAEAKLDGGDLPAAVAEVASLQGAPRAAFTNWLDQARARVDAEETLRRLKSALLASLTTNAPSSGGKTQEEPREQD